MEEIFNIVFNFSKSKNDNGGGEGTKSKSRETTEQPILEIIYRVGKVWAETMD